MLLYTYNYGVFVHARISHIGTTSYLHFGLFNIFIFLYEFYKVQPIGCIALSNLFYTAKFDYIYFEVPCLVLYVKCCMFPCFMYEQL